MILDSDGTIMVDVNAFFLLQIRLRFLLQFSNLQSTTNELHLVDDLDHELRTKIKKQLKVGLDFARDTTRASNTSYTTIVHRDLWINNIMIKRSKCN